jgi:hypothetical protein
MQISFAMMLRRPSVLALAATLTALTILPVSAARADPEVPDVVYPNIAPHATAAEGFLPKGWEIEQTVEGDLNGDGKPDLLAILRDTDPHNVLKNDDGLGPNPFNTNPRILVIALKNAHGGYDLALANHTLIPRDTEPNIDDPLEDAANPTIMHGILKIGLHLSANAGGASAGSIGYVFRLDQGRLVMIGYESSIVDRMSGEMDFTSANYLTGKLKLDKGSIENDRKKTTWKPMPSKKLLRLEDIGNGMDFDPTQPSH